MMNFCTLFDSNYLQRGLALYESLCKTSDDFCLYVVTFDDKAFTILKELNLPSLVAVNLPEFETPELLEVKPSRSRAEYCWTCGPSVIYYFIEKYNLESCTYLDADLYFFRSPKILFDEIGSKSIAITDHYAPYEVPQGRYCVQFMYFKNDEWGMKALKWWRDSCIEWCYAHWENNKYGDQKYLEQFPIRFKNVHVVKSRGAGVASWNMNSYQYDSNNFELSYDNEIYPIVFVHYHALGMAVHDMNLTLSPATFDISPKVQFLFDLYANEIISIFHKYLDVKINTYIFKKRSLRKILYARLKATFRNVGWIKYLYENFIRSEYKGYD